MIVDAHYDLGPLLQEAYHKKKSDYFGSTILKKWKSNNVKIVTAAVFLENEQVEAGPLEAALEQVQLIKNAIKDSEECIIISCKEDLDKVLREDLIGVLISLEGLEPIGENLLMLDLFYDLGVRAAGLTWSRENAVADGSRFGIPSSDLGITKFGSEVINRMRDLKMIVDVSHLNDAGLDDLNGTIIASHSNARGVRDIARNISDEHIKKIATSGGIIGINNVKPIVSKEPSISSLCDHIDYIKSLVGSEFICFGFDLCDELDIDVDLISNGELKSIDILNGYEDVQLITEELKSRGYSQEEFDGITHLNYIRFLKKNL